MSIKYSASSAQVTNVQIVDSDNLNIPNGDFVIATMIHTDGTFGPAQQHLINAGVTFGAGHFALLLETGGQINAQTDVNQSGVNLIHQTALALNTSYLVGMRRLGTSLKSFFCPVLQTAPTDGSAVSVSTKSRSINVALNASGNVTIGQRLGSSTNRGDHSMARTFACIGTFTDLDLAKLAYGMEITDLGKAPLWYIRANDGLDTADRGPNNNPTTRSTGTDPLPTGTAFNFGYVSVNRAPTVTAPSIDGTPTVGATSTYTSGTIDGFPYPTVTQKWYVAGIETSTAKTYVPGAADEGKALTVRQFVTSTEGSADATSSAKTVAASPIAVYITPPQANWVTNVLSLSNRVAPVTFSGTYTGGEQPARIEYRLLDVDNLVERKTWADIGATIVAGGTWSANPSIPGHVEKYRIQARMVRADGTVLATTAVHPNAFGVGFLIAMGGSSSAETWGYGISGTANVKSTSQIRSPDAWGTPYTYATRMAAYIAERLGLVVGIIHGGIGGSSIGGNDGWATNGTKWSGIRDVIAASGGRLGGMFVTVGSNDAGAAAVSSQASHEANMRAVIGIARGLGSAVNPTMPVLWAGYNSRTTTSKTADEFNTASNYVREAEKKVGFDANVYLLQSTHFEVGDGIHLSGGPLGYLAQTSQMSFLFSEALQGRYPRGPEITSFTFTGNKVKVSLVHHNGSDLVPSTGATGFAVSDANGVRAIQSVVRVNANLVEITCDQALVAPVKTTHLSGGTINGAAPLLDNGTFAMPASVETLMATTEATAAPDATAPVMTGTVTATNVTSTGAVISWPVATDDTAVTGYEYSTNGGTSYVNANTARTATLSGLSPSTTYQLRARAYDAAGNRSTPVSGVLTTIAEVVTPPPDITAPVLSGMVTTANITGTTGAISWPSATDNVAVTGYEYSLNGGTSYINAGTALTASLASLTASTTYPLRVRAYDAAGNRSAPITGSLTTAAPAVTPTGFSPSASRTVKVLAGRNAYEVGPFWSVSGNSSPVGSKDPNSTIDIHFDWTNWLADIGGAQLSAVDFILSPGLISTAGIPTTVGGTVFVSGGTVGQNLSITCRITSATTPARVEDRTVVLQIKEQ